MRRRLSLCSGAAGAAGAVARGTRESARRARERSGSVSYEAALSAGEWRWRPGDGGWSEAGMGQIRWRQAAARTSDVSATRRFSRRRHVAFL
nr:unnamed protein product [Digitaria exilis]